MQASRGSSSLAVLDHEDAKSERIESVEQIDAVTVSAATGGRR